MSRKLQYFDVNGYAEAVRYMLHYGKLEFEDIRYKRDDWPIKSVKDALPYGQLPIYEEDGRVLIQTLAIARYVAHEVGLLPSDPWEQAVVEAAALNCYDFVKKIVTLMLDPSKIEENKKNIDEAVEFYLSRFEKELKTGNGYFGGKLSWADFILVGMIETTNLYLKGSIEKNYPTVTALISKIYSLPGIKEYVAKRGLYVLNL